MSPAITVLVIDDSKAVRGTTRDLLLAEGDIAVIEAGDGLSGLRLLAEKRPDLVLCDLEMPLADGRKFLSLVRSRADLRDVPVIMLTADDDVELKADLLDLGASDYLTKPFHARELLARLRIQQRLVQLTAALRTANERLRETTVLDAVTSLPNRRWLDETLALEMARARRYAAPLSVAIVGIDGLDALPPAAREALLRDVASAVHEGVRCSDRAARFDETRLAVLMPHTAIAGANDVAQRLRDVLATTTGGPARLGCRARVGVVAYDATARVQDVATLLAAACDALAVAR